MASLLLGFYLLQDQGFGAATASVAIGGAIFACIACNTSEELGKRKESGVDVETQQQSDPK